MNFFVIMKSLDDLLFEVMSWTVFYPVTMARAVRRPIDTMAMAAEEAVCPAETRFRDTLSPPIFLLLSVLVAHGIELAAIGESELIARTDRLAGLVHDDTSLIILRLVAFASFPLIFAVRNVRAQGQPLTRATLEPMFFAQCYGNAPFALTLSVAATASQMTHPWADRIAASLIFACVMAFAVLQTAWFRRILDCGWARAAAQMAAAYAIALLFLVLLTWLVGSNGLT